MDGSWTLEPIADLDTPARVEPIEPTWTPERKRAGQSWESADRVRGNTLSTATPGMNWSLPRLRGSGSVLLLTLTGSDHVVPPSVERVMSMSAYP